MTFPSDGMALTHILVVSDMERAKIFYRDVLGAGSSAKSVATDKLRDERR